MTAGTLWRWACPIISIALAVATVIIFDWSLWKILMLAVLLTCPVVAAWAVIQGQKPLPFPIGPVPETRGKTLDRLAPYYDMVCRMAGIGGSFRNKITETARFRLGEKVLDIGCGTGVLTRLAADAVGPEGEVLGIDPAADMIRIARQEARGVGNPAKFEPAAVEHLPFAAGTFDVAMLSFVVHCLPSDLKRAGLAETWRVLKRGGRLIVVDLDRPRNALAQALLSPFLGSIFLGEHLRGRIPDLLRHAGFEPVIETDRWKGIVTIWVAVKPAKDVA